MRLPWVKDKAAEREAKIVAQALQAKAKRHREAVAILVQELEALNRALKGGTHDVP